MLKNQKGITLIALVITIIVLLILAGVSIAMLTGNNGILTQANNSKYSTARAEAVEKINLALNAVKTEVYAKRVNDADWDPTADTNFTDAIKPILTTDDIVQAVNGEGDDGKIVYSWDNTTLTISYYGVSAAKLEAANKITGKINLDPDAAGTGNEPNSFLEMVSATLPANS